MRKLLMLWGVAVIGLAVAPRTSAFDLLVLPDSFDDRTLVYGDGDPVYTTLGDLRSAQALKVDPYDGRLGNPSSAQESATPFEINTSQSANPAAEAQASFNTATPENLKRRPLPGHGHSVPEPSSWAFALLGVIGAVIIATGRKPRR